VGLVLIDGQQLRRIPDPDRAHVTETRTPVFPLDSPMPSARAARDGVIVLVGDRGALEADYGQVAVAEYDAAGLRSAVCVPLPGTRRTLGVLILGWVTTHQADVTERAVLTAIAGYTAWAIERALHLEERITAARQLQQAMLTDLPAFPGLELAVSYQPAATGELVGGDWYDAYPLASRSAGPGPDGARSPVPMAIMVGDITGHDRHAAAIMGQVRSMLRQADLHDDLDPARAVAAVEKTCERLSLAATGTLVHGHLRPIRGAGAWQLTWTNAGHPPLLLRHLDGQVEQLGAHDLLLWPGMPDSRRTDQQRNLVPGDTLLLYTDGLVERHADGMDAAISRISALLSAASAGQPLPELLTQLTGTATGSASDDIVLLAIRIPGATG
jgi:serine phosphatase RsbU (regulator of sigma subunit)